MVQSPPQVFIVNCPIGVEDGVLPVVVVLVVPEVLLAKFEDMTPCKVALPVVEMVTCRITLAFVICVGVAVCAETNCPPATNPVAAIAINSL